MWSQKLIITFPFEFLSYMDCLNVDLPTVFTFFKHCRDVIVMHYKLVSYLMTRQDRHVLWLSLPNAFRNEIFCKTVCIFTCIEIFMQRPVHIVIHHTLCSDTPNYNLSWRQDISFFLQMAVEGECDKYAEYINLLLLLEASSNTTTLKSNQ